MKLEVRLLGAFEVRVDGRALPPDAFEQRRAADLVKLLALAHGHRLARDEVVEQLWPHLAPEAGVANLHKAAHYARRALGARDAVVLRQGMVELAPGGTVGTDVERFEAGDDDAYGGELLPDDRYEAWTAAARERVRERRLQTLRAGGRWHDVLAEDPADEEAHRALMRAELEAGNRQGAARRFQILRDELGRLGLQPDPETVALYEEAARGDVVHAPRALTGPVAGRREELAEAVRALRLAAEGRGSTLVIAGEAGMGKTRLVEALLQGAERRGLHTLRGAGRDAEGAPPYGPLVEALDPLLRRRPDLLERLGDGSRRALALLTPAAGHAEGDAASERHRLLAAIGHLLDEAARERGVVLALEDLHAADEATLRLVDYLSGAARATPLIVVATLRPAPADSPPDRLVRGLSDRRAAVVMRLGPLDDDAVREIGERAARAPLDPAAADALVVAAAGNPFYAQELGATATPGGGDVRVPPRLADLLDARLDRLGPEPDGVLAALVVLDDGADPAALAAAAGVDAAAVDAVLERAAAAGVLGADDGGWRFRHPLLREAAGARVPEALQVAAHGRVADWLAAHGGAPERVAHHLVAAGRGEEAVAPLEAAARRAAQVGAYGDGRRWVELALRHAPDERRPGLYALLGDLRFATGDRAAIAAYATAVRRATPSEAIDLRIKQARALLALGDVEGAHTTLVDLPEGAPRQQAHAAVARGVLAWYRGDMDEAARQVETAERLAGDDDDIEDLVDLRAMVAHAQGRWEPHALLELTGAWQVPHLAGRVSDAYLCVTQYALQATEPYERLLAFARDLREQARRAGARRGEAFGATLLGEALLLAGDADGARRQLADAVRLNREVGAVGGEALARARMAEALAVAGDEVGSAAHVDEAIELAHASTIAHHLLFIVYAAQIRLRHADPAAALAAVDVAEVVLEDQRGCRFCPIGYQLAAAWACARAGEPGRGRELLDRAVEGTRLWPPGLWSAPICEARGELAAADGDGAQAVVQMRRAADVYASAGQRLHATRVTARLADIGGAAAPA